MWRYQRVASTDLFGYQNMTLPLQCPNGPLRLKKNVPLPMRGPNQPFTWRLSCTQNCPKFKLHTLNWNLTQFFEQIETGSKLKLAVPRSERSLKRRGREEMQRFRSDRPEEDISRYIHAYFWFKPTSLSDFSQKLVPAKQLDLKRRGRDAEGSVRSASRTH